MCNPCWIPDLMLPSNYTDFKHYYDAVYGVFHEDFVESHPVFEGQKVVIRRMPIENGREDAFYHVTCKDFLHTQDRQPDLRRCERIHWIRKFIENYKCENKDSDDCDGIKYWEAPYHNRKRVFLLSEEESYIVILEKRQDYILLITAYYIEYDRNMDKLLNEWEKYR